MHPRRFLFLSIFRFAAEGWGEETREKCKEIFGFARASPRARPRRVPARAERTLQFRVGTRSARRPSRARKFQFAETEGFEPSRAFTPYLVSSEALSTTQPRLQYLIISQQPFYSFSTLSAFQKGLFSFCIRLKTKCFIINKFPWSITLCRLNLLFIVLGKSPF